MRRGKGAGIGGLMDFASDAMFDIAVAPSPRAEPRTPAASEADGESFSAHLDEATQEPANTRDTSRPDVEATSIALPDQTPVAPPQTPATPAAITLQLIAQQTSPTTPTTPTTKGVDTPATQPVAPTNAASQTPVQSATPQAPTATPEAPVQSAGAGAADKTAALTDAKPASNKSDTPQVTPAQPPSTQTAQPEANAAVVAPTQSQAQVTAQSAAVADPAALHALAGVAAAPAPAAPAPSADVRTPRANADAAKQAAKVDGEAPPVDPKAAAANAANAAQGSQKQQGKVSSVGAVAKDGAAPAATPATTQSVDTALPTPQLATSATTASTASAQQVSADHNVARAASAAAQVGREIIRRFDGDTTTFELRLDPPELGRVEVKLEVTRDHRVTAIVAADTPQALSELARHARELEQSLQQAGLELTENGLSFDLRQGEHGAEQTEGGNGRSGGRDSANADENVANEAAPRARPIGLERWRGVRVDVMA